MTLGCFARAMLHLPAEGSMIEDEQFLKQAIELARQARTAGNHPFGALLVLDGRVVLTARNTVVTQHNPTAHAERNLVGGAIRQLSLDQIARCVLYTSCEPCAMCSQGFLAASSGLTRFAAGGGRRDNVPPPNPDDSIRQWSASRG